MHLMPFRAAAALSSSARAPAASPNAVLPHGGYGIANRERKEVPLPSQEGTKGVVQYALYVPSPTQPLFGSIANAFRPPAQPSTSSPTGRANPRSGP